jgi:hypothetical protein
MVRAVPSSQAAWKLLSPRLSRESQEQKLAVGIENLEPGDTRLPPRGVGRTKKTCRFPVTTLLARDMREAFERVPNGHVAM